MATQPQTAHSRNSLKSIAVFAAMTPDAIERIERRCAWKRYAPGEPILSYLDKSDDVRADRADTRGNRCLHGAVRKEKRTGQHDADWPDWYAAQARPLLARYRRHGQIGILYQTFLKVVRASNDPKQTWIGLCAILCVVYDQPHLAADARIARSAR